MASHIPNRKTLDLQYPRTSITQTWRDYEHGLRHTLQTGDLVFFSGNGLFSTLIQWRSRSAWSHVGMVIRIEEIDKTFLVESVIDHGGVRLIPMSACLKDYAGDNKPYSGRIAVARYPELDKQSIEKIKLRAFELLSKQYDHRELIRIAWRTFVGRSKLFPDAKYTCAELVHACYQSAGIRLKYPYGDFISPTSFWDLSEVEMLGMLL